MMEKICAFDIGMKHFAFAIIRVTSLPENDNVSSWWNCVHMSCIDLGGDVLKNLHIVLQKEFVEDRNLTQGKWTVLIERQMVVNHKAVQLAAHVQAFFMIHYPYLPLIDYASTLKTRVLGVRFTKKSDRKKWSTETVKQYFTEQRDHISLEWLNTFKKQDDICDCILMCVTYARQRQK